MGPFSRFSFLSPVVLAASLPAAASAQSGVTIYGLTDAGVEVSNQGKGTQTREIAGGAGGSRLGFKGQEDLGGGLSAIFQLEMGFTLDDGQLAQGGRAFGRQSLVGLSSTRWGTLTAGRTLNPYYNLIINVDAHRFVGNGGYLSVTRNSDAVQQLMPQALTTRSDNSISYASPSIRGFQVQAQIALPEKSALLGRGYAGSVRYTQGPLDLNLGWSRQHGSSSKPSSGGARAVVAGGSYDFEPVRLFLGFVDEANSCTTCAGALTLGSGVRERRFRIISTGLRVPVSPQLTAVGQVMRINDRSDYVASTGNRDATSFSLGLEYHMSKRTLIYASAATVGNRNGSAYAWGTGTTQQPASAVAGDARAKAMSLGLRHVF